MFTFEGNFDNSDKTFMKLLGLSNLQSTKKLTVGFIINLSNGELVSFFFISIIFVFNMYLLNYIK